MKHEPFTVATIQPFEPRDARQNARMQEEAWRLAESASDQGARLIVLPEYFNIMGVPLAQCFELIADCTPQHERAAAFCRCRDAWLLLPLVEERQGRRYNTAHLINPDGTTAYTYDKTHLTLCEKRDYQLTPGSKIDTVDTDLGRIAVIICYDIYFPEVCDVLRLLRTQLILFPSLQRSDTEQNVMLLNRARALDATCYLVRSSYSYTAHSIPETQPRGGSCIIGPDGAILSNAGHAPGAAVALIDPHTPWRRPRCHGEALTPVREFLAEDRRPSLYKSIWAS